MTYQLITRMRVTRQQLNLPHYSSLITNWYVLTVLDPQRLWSLPNHLIIGLSQLLLLEPFLGFAPNFHEAKPSSVFRILQNIEKQTLWLSGTRSPNRLMGFYQLICVLWSNAKVHKEGQLLGHYWSKGKVELVCRGRMQDRFVFRRGDDMRVEIDVKAHSPK